jgi:hypothetical protein
MAKFNAAFWKWFGKSKVVDAEGRPLVVYHGTNRKFWEFKESLPERLGDPEGVVAGSCRMGGFYFTTDKRIARGFGKRVIAAYLRAERIFDYENPRQIEVLVRYLRTLPTFAAWDERDVRDGDWKIMERSEELQDFLRARYDSYFVNEHAPEGYANKSIVVFSPTQIKSATGNRGTWSRTDPDIRRNPGPGYRKPGDRVYFEYHCYESPESSDAELWFRSHQRVTVLKLTERGGGDTKRERCANGEPAAYDVKFADGFIGTAVEDELVDSKKQFFRPDSPRRSGRNPAVGRCFVDAYMAVLKDTKVGPKNALLSSFDEVAIVHGKARVADAETGKPKAGPHAWVEFRAGKFWFVYDPANNLLTGRDTYYKDYDAKPKQRYSKAQVTKLRKVHKHCGPFSSGGS